MLANKSAAPPPPPRLSQDYLSLLQQLGVIALPQGMATSSGAAVGAGSTSTYAQQPAQPSSSVGLMSQPVMTQGGTTTAMDAQGRRL